MEDSLYAFAFRNQYDIISNEATRNILSIIKKMIYDGVKENSFTFKIDRIQFGGNIDTRDTGHTEYNSFPFNIEARLDNYPDTKENYIIINISLDNQFSNKNLEQINNDIYKKVRHEVEHLLDFETEKFPNDIYREIYEESLNDTIGQGKMTEEQILAHIKLVSNYITNDTEILPYARSILYSAKKQKKEIHQIIQQFFNKAFYNNCREYALIVKDNKEAQDIINKTKEALLEKIRSFYPKLIRTYPML